MSVHMDHGGWSGGEARPARRSWPTPVLLAALAFAVVSLLGSVIDEAGPGSGAPPVAVAGAVELADGRDPTSIDHLAVVRISVTSCGERVVGSGFLLSDGVVVTAGHVVGDAGLVRIDQGSTTVTGEVLGVVADGRDLALVAVDGPVDAPIVAAPVPRIGEPVTLAGHPLGRGLSVVVGERVDLDAAPASLARGPAFGVSATTAVGMSGAPALDSSGRLVGVVVGAEERSGTAIVVAVDDAATLASEVLVPGRCSITA